MHSGQLLISWAVSILLNQTPEQWRPLEQSRRVVKLFSKSCRVIENCMLKCAWPNLPNKFMHPKRNEWFVLSISLWTNRAPIIRIRYMVYSFHCRLVLQSNSMFIYAIWSSAIEMSIRSKKQDHIPRIIWIYWHHYKFQISYFHPK